MTPNELADAVAEVARLKEVLLKAIEMFARAEATKDTLDKWTYERRQEDLLDARNEYEAAQYFLPLPEIEDGLRLLEKWPTTADGASTFPDMKVWHPGDLRDDFKTPVTVEWVIGQVGLNFAKLKEYYSSAAAASAAAGEPNRV